MVSVLLKQSVCYLLIQLPTFVKRELFALITFAALVTFGYVMRLCCVIYPLVNGGCVH